MSASHRDEIVKALLAEMRAKLAERDEAGVLCLSNILATFTAEPSIPEEMAFTYP